ncbi:MAG: carboxymuconolactone decarboxylase family protein [Pseudomonadota bacterium]|nr:carboxymuconolactone decarboxylase family protein [Pseudomonadota bacterium]
MRISERGLSDYPWYLKPFFWNQRRKYGQVLKPALLWARVPKLFVAVASLYGVLDRRSSPLSPEMRSLITVRVSQINWCRFCVDINSATLAERSGSLDKVQAVENWRESDIFSAREKVSLEYAEAITFTDEQVTGKLMEELRSYFDEDSIVELTALIAFQNLSSKFNSALDLPAQGFCSIPFRPEKKARGST